MFAYRNELRTSLEVALVRTGAAATRTWTNFWASHQRFFRQLWYVMLHFQHCCSAIMYELFQL